MNRAMQFSIFFFLSLLSGCGSSESEQAFQQRLQLLSEQEMVLKSEIASYKASLSAIDTAAESAALKKYETLIQCAITELELVAKERDLIYRKLDSVEDYDSTKGQSDYSFQMRVKSLHLLIRI
ncbi:MAG: hypothetical protein JW739_00825 [Opitutales bacterium]|nr:hypothetical protein [Opitutales bacterium]